MSLSRAIGEALDQGVEGTVEASHAGAKARLDVVATGPVGVRVRAVHVERGRDVGIEEAAAELPEQLARVLPERIEAIEVDPGLGGAILRTSPSEMDGPRFVEVEVTGTRQVDIRRWSVAEGDREPEEWAMTRDALGRLLDDLA